MISQIESELNNLRTSLLELANLALMQLDKAGSALKNNDLELVNEVLHYEKRVNGLEVNVEKAAENILALYNPVANDLRFVLSTLKINLNLERIGDYATGIAKLVKRRGSGYNPKLLELLAIEECFETCHLMLLSTIEALEPLENGDSLRGIFLKDDVLNGAQQGAPDKIIEYLATSKDDFKECLELYVVVRKLERIGDHVKNIAEEIIFYKEAKILRHTKKNSKKGN